MSGKEWDCASPRPWSGPPSPTGITWASCASSENIIRSHNLDQIRMALSAESAIFLQGFDLNEFASRVERGQVVQADRKVQAGLQHRRILAKDGPRLIFDNNGRLVMFYAPQFWDEHERVEAVSALNDLIQYSGLTKDVTDTDESQFTTQEQIKKPQAADGRVDVASKHKGSHTYWHIYQHGLGQQFKQGLNFSSSLRENGGKKGAGARVEYLKARRSQDQKINDILELLNPELFRGLNQAREQFESRGGTGDWLDHWHALFPGLAIIKNRQTQLHRDKRGAQYAGDFLSVFGDFVGGDLSLPDLNLDFEWTSGAACFFDGRTFSHEVKSWEGSLRLCLVSYLWKTSMDALNVTMPLQSMTYGRLQQIVSANFQQVFDSFVRLDDM